MRGGLEALGALGALRTCEHIWPFSLRDIWATLLSPKWAEIFVAQMAGDERSLPRRFCQVFGVLIRNHFTKGINFITDGFQIGYVIILLWKRLSFW